MGKTANNGNENVLFLGILILLSEKIAVFRLEIATKNIWTKLFGKFCPVLISCFFKRIIEEFLGKIFIR